MLLIVGLCLGRSRRGISIQSHMQNGTSAFQVLLSSVLFIFRTYVMQEAVICTTASIQGVSKSFKLLLTLRHPKSMDPPNNSSGQRNFRKITSMKVIGDLGFDTEGRFQGYSKVNFLFFKQEPRSLTWILKQECFTFGYVFARGSE